MKNSENRHLEQRVAEMEGRVEALSIVLHATIFVADDTLRGHKDVIIAMLDDLAVSHPNPVGQEVLREWVQGLRHGT